MSIYIYARTLELDMRYNRTGLLSVTCGITSFVIDLTHTINVFNCWPNCFYIQLMLQLPTAEVRAKTMPCLPKQRGTGLLVTGISLTGEAASARREESEGSEIGS